MHRVLDRVTYHAVYDDSIMAALYFASSHALAGVQIPLDLPRFSPYRVTADERKQIKSFCQEHNLRISLHTPDDSVSLFAPPGPVSQGILEYFADVFDLAADIGAATVTIHPGAMPSFPLAGDDCAQRLPPADLHELLSAFEMNLSKLIKLADTVCTLCIENVRLTDEVCVLLDGHLVAGEIALCWDIAKSAGDQRRERWLTDNIAHVRQVHLHDTKDGLSHQVIGSGELDIASYLALFAEADVHEFCIEVRPGCRAIESFHALQSLLTSCR